MHVVVEQKATTTTTKSTFPDHITVSSALSLFALSDFYSTCTNRSKNKSSTSACFASNIHSKTHTMASAWNLNGRDICHASPAQLAVYIQSTVPKFSLPSCLRQQPAIGDHCLRKVPGELQKVKIHPTSSIKQACESVGEQSTAFCRYTTQQVWKLNRIICE